jgi:hypothetical protein
MGNPVHLSPGGLPETVLDPEPPDAVERLRTAATLEGEERRRAIAAVVADHPRCLQAWADLGDEARDDIEAYAAYRVGYHRGLDRLRANGWRGSGYVRWRHPENTGFLRSLAGLGRIAGRIGEIDEAERCALFLGQLDPTTRPDAGAS